MPNDPVTNIRISVITVVRNGAEFIGQTIRSVLEQDYPNFEYIVIDGLSSDGTVDIIKSYEPQITYWSSEKDNGIADAFNKGLAQATGDYLLFLNADDTLANPDVLSAMAHEIIANGFPILIYGDCNVLERSSGKTLYYASIEYSPDGLMHGQMIPQPSLFTHRSYFEKYGVFDNQFRIAMDYEWLLRGILKEKTIHLRQLITCVRNGGVSTLDRVRVIDEIILALRKNGYISSLWQELSLRSYFHGRAFVRATLSSLGLYGAFNFFRHQLSKQDVSDMACKQRNQ